MSHEHFPGCGHGDLIPHHHEHHHHEEVAHHLGSLCCQGQCFHPEHQGQGQLEAQQRAQLETQLHEEDDDEIDPKTGRKAKKRSRGGDQFPVGIFLRAA